MTSSPVSRESGTESVEQTGVSGSDMSTSNVLGKVRQTLTSSGFAGLTGGLMVLRGLRAVRHGKRLRGIARIVAGGILLATVYRRRRQSGAGQRSQGAGIDQEDVVDTSPDIEDAAGETSSDATDDRGGGEGRAEIDFASGVDEPQEGIGSGTFDAQRGVPVPETAFDEGFLELDGEAFWAIRDSDDAVFVSRDRSVFEDSDGVEYVTSSEVDDEQTLSVPDVILDHWESVDGTEPVTDDDELVFATTDDLRWVEVLWIVSEHRTDEFDEL